MKNSQIEQLKQNVALLEEKLKQGQTKNLAQEIEGLKETLRIQNALLAIEKSPDGFKTLAEHLAKAIKESINEIEYPDNITISNPVKEVTVANFPKEKEYPKEIEVSNLKEIKIPAMPKEVKVSGFNLFLSSLKSIKADLKEFTSKTLKAVVTGEVSISNRNLNEAIPVKLVSNDGKYFYTAIQNMLGAMGSAITQLKNADGAVINPATEETLQDILVNLGGGATSLGSGIKTVTTAGTREALASSTPCKRVHIRALDSNGDYVYVGGASVSSTSGVFLGPQDSITISINDLASVYLDSAVNGEGVVYTYEN